MLTTTTPVLAKPWPNCNVSDPRHGPSLATFDHTMPRKDDTGCRSLVWGRMRLNSCYIHRQNRRSSKQAQLAHPRHVTLQVGTSSIVHKITIGTTATAPNEHVLFMTRPLPPRTTHSKSNTHLWCGFAVPGTLFMVRHPNPKYTEPYSLTTPPPSQQVRPHSAPPQH